ncbi:MAG: hypothetical protein KDB22_12520, partial [Planctomycetales bacterium]|nr:hypothetical protein [Planctomycetales bacterium]
THSATVDQVIHSRIVVGDVADAANLVVADASGQQDTQIALNIAANSNDADGSESLRLEIDSLPAGSRLTDGEHQFVADAFNQLVDISNWNWPRLAIIPPAGSDADIVLTVRATTTEDSNGDSVTVSDQLHVEVREVVLQPAAVASTAPAPTPQLGNEPAPTAQAPTLIITPPKTTAAASVAQTAQPVQADESVVVSEQAADDAGQPLEASSSEEEPERKPGMYKAQPNEVLLNLELESAELALQFERIDLQTLYASDGIAAKADQLAALSTEQIAGLQRVERRTEEKIVIDAVEDEQRNLRAYAIDSQDPAGPPRNRLGLLWGLVRAMSGLVDRPEPTETARNNSREKRK